MNPSALIDLFNYNAWANRRVWSCVEMLSEPQFSRPLDYSHGSLRDQCFHIMAVEDWWFRYLHTGELRFLELEDFPTRAAIRDQWEKVSAAIDAYLVTMTPQELERKVRPDFWDEGNPSIFVWQALFQVAHHSTDHRAQVLAGVAQFGGVTTGQDYLDYLFG